MINLLINVLLFGDIFRDIGQCGDSGVDDKIILKLTFRTWDVVKDWTIPAQVMHSWRPLVPKVINCGVPENFGIPLVGKNG